MEQLNIHDNARILLKILGLWPLEKKTISTTIRRSLHTIAQLMTLPFLFLDLIGSKNGDANVETIIFVTVMMSVLVKNVCLTYNQKKLGINVNAAFDDWLSIKNDEIAQRIMKKYAFKTRMLTFVTLYSGVTCLTLYCSSVIAINLKEVFLTDPNIDKNKTEWLFVMPSGSLSNTLTSSQYAIILAIQILQTCSLCIVQCVVDSFYFNITTHLAGQLEVLKNKFEIFAKESDTEANSRKKFAGLINRHKELMDLYQNLEDSFQFLILHQLMTNTVMLALIGLRIILCLDDNNHVEFMKSAVVMNYALLESFVFTYGGDFLQTESEGIFYGLYAASWFTLPLALMKDVHFAMMKSSTPFRLTGGKFFYVNRETMMYILKTSASYVSVFRLALKN